MENKTMESNEGNIDIEIIVIEEYVKEGKQVPKAKHYKIRVNDETFVIQSETITGKEILELVKETSESYNVYQHIHHGQTKLIQPDERVDLTESGVERFTTEKHEGHKEVTIIVNTREKQWEKENISYEEVVLLAFGSYSDDERITYTVTYTRGDDSKPDGSLIKGQSVKVKNGMIFNVTETNKS